MVNINNVRYVARLRRIRYRDVLLRAGGLSYDDHALSRDRERVMVEAVLDRTGIRPNVVLEAYVRRGLNLVLLFLSERGGVLNEVLRLSSDDVALIFSIRLLYGNEDYD